MRILILTAATGGGHKRTAAALKEAVSKSNKENNDVVEIVDALEVCGRFFNKTVTGGYHYMATKAPKVYGHAYRMSDSRSPLNSFMDSINAQVSVKLLPTIVNFRADVIVTCHPFAAKMMGVLKGKGYINQPIVAIITDFKGHRAYIDDNIDKYVVANDDMIAELVVKYSVNREKIFSLGIPIFSEFYSTINKDDIFKELNFNKDLPVLLLMAGSFGVTDVLSIYENIVDLDSKFQIIVITGKNKKLYDAFEKILNKEIKEFDVYEDTQTDENSYPFEAKNKERRQHSHLITKLASDVSYQIKDKTIEIKDNIKDKTIEIKDNIKEKSEQINESLKDSMSKLPFSHYIRTTTKTKPTKLFYFINNVQDYMHIADLIVTKPGGLTVSESLATGLPLAIFRAFPGQEEDNADFLIKKGMAISLEKGRKGARQIEEILTNKEELEKMKNNCRTYFKNKSAENVYELIAKTLEEHLNSFAD